MPVQKNTHWTEEAGSFKYYIADEFVDALKKRLNEIGFNQSQFAKRIGVSEGRVSQIFNNPGNLTLSKMVDWSRNLGLKLAIVTYNDKDPNNELGPVVADVFSGLWALHHNPRDYMDLQNINEACGFCGNASKWIDKLQTYNYEDLYVEEQTLTNTDLGFIATTNQRGESSPSSAGAFLCFQQKKGLTLRRVSSSFEDKNASTIGNQELQQWK